MSDDDRWEFDRWEYGPAAKGPDGQTAWVEKGLLWVTDPQSSACLPMSVAQRLVGIDEAAIRRAERIKVLRELATEMGDRPFPHPRSTQIECEWADELDRRADDLAGAMRAAPDLAPRDSDERPNGHEKPE